MTIDELTPSATAPGRSAAGLRGGSPVLLIYGGRIFLLGCWFLATRLLAVTLGPGGFGLYFLCQSAIRVVSGCIGDPLDMAVMREAPLLLRSNRSAALDLIRSAFWLRVCIAAAVLVMAVLLPGLAARAYFCFAFTSRVGGVDDGGGSG